MKTIFTALVFTLISASSFASTQVTIESFWAEYCPTVKAKNQTKDLGLFCKMKDLKKNRQELISFYKDISVVTGEVRFENWGNLSLEEREKLEKLETIALNISSSLITEDVCDVLDGGN